MEQDLSVKHVDNVRVFFSQAVKEREHKLNGKQWKKGQIY